MGDLEAAKTFAQDVLGLGEPVTEFEAPDHGLVGAFFGLGDANLEVYTLAGAQPAQGPGTIDHIAVRVDDIDAEQARLAAQGVRFTGPAVTDPVDAPIDLRGGRHLWTDPATSGGYRLQLIEKP